MKNNSKGARIAIYAGLVLWMLVNLFPVYWMFTFSLKDNPEIFGDNVIGLPRHWLWSNYTRALGTGNMGRYFLNSAIVATATIIITLVVALMATFALTRLIWKRRRTLNKFFMLGLTIPIHASIVPVYVTLSRLHMLNTYWALIIPYSAFSLAMAILVCTGFMNEIPRELDESACIDGCSTWGIFLRVIVPLMKPAVATVGIYTFLQCWNELMFANIFISKSALAPSARRSCSPPSRRCCSTSSCRRRSRTASWPARSRADPQQIKQGCNAALFFCARRELRSRSSRP